MKNKINKVIDSLDKAFGEISDTFDDFVQHTKPVKNFKKYVITKFNNLGEIYYLTYDNVWTPTFFASENLTEYKVALYDQYSDAETLVNKICEQGHQGVFTILTVYKTN